MAALAASTTLPPNHTTHLQQRSRAALLGKDSVQDTKEVGATQLGKLVWRSPVPHSRTRTHASLVSITKCSLVQEE